MKKYISQGRDYVIFVNLGDKQECVRFHDMGQYRNCGVFVTSDLEMEKAIEAHCDFGKYFFIDEEHETEEAPKPREYDYTYPVKRTQEAIRILVDIHNVQEDELKKKIDVLLKADELNISFPNL